MQSLLKSLFESEHDKHLPLESQPLHLYPHDAHEFPDCTRPELQIHSPVNWREAPSTHVWQIEG